MPTTLLISKSYDGGTAVRQAYLPPLRQAAAMSEDGRYLAFISNATNLASGADGRSQVFLKDRVAGTIELVSRSNGGTVGDFDCQALTMTPDGRYLLFLSQADNLVDGDTNHAVDLFLRDRATGGIQRVNLSSDGTQANQTALGPIAISAGGRWVAFYSFASNLSPQNSAGHMELFVRDLLTGATEVETVTPAGLASAGNVGGNGVSISADGRYVAFDCYAADLVNGDTNGVEDVFVRDRWQGITSRVSVTSAGQPADANCDTATMTPDGRYVAFASRSGALLGKSTSGPSQVFVRDMTTGALDVLSVNPAGSPGTGASTAPTLSSDGRFVVFSSIAPDLVAAAGSSLNVYIRDRQAGATVRVSEAVGGGPGDGLSTFWPCTPSADGRLVLFPSDADNLTVNPGGTGVLYLRDRSAGETLRMSDGGNGTLAVTTAYSSGPTMSADGRFIAFFSDATNLVPGDMTVRDGAFVYDRRTGTTQRVALPEELAANSSVVAMSFSANGRYLVFTTDSPPSPNVFSGDVLRVFVLDRLTGNDDLVSPLPGGAEVPAFGLGSSMHGAPAISGDGRFVSFFGMPSPDQPLALPYLGVYVRDRFLGTTECASVALGGSEANGAVVESDLSMSADGRYIAFASKASNLIGGDINQAADVFVRDRVAHSTDCVSFAGSTQGDADSLAPSLSADGRVITFATWASNLGATPGSYYPQIVAKDRSTDALTLVTTTIEGHPANSGASASRISADGQSVLFVSDDQGLVGGDARSQQDAYVRDLPKSETERISVAANGSQAAPRTTYHVDAGISGTGALGAFTSDATNLTGDAPSGGMSLFLRIRSNAPVPVAPGGLSASISGNPPQVRLEWSDQSDNEALFRVERSADGGLSWVEVGAAGANSPVYVDTTAGQNAYLYRVRAANESGDSPPTAPVSATIGSELPTAPTNLKVSLVAPTTLQLTWRNTSGNSPTFQVERKSGAAEFTEIASTQADETAYTDSGLISNMVYTYRVRAHTALGDSSYCEPATGSTPPQAPTGLEAHATTQGVVITWTDPNLVPAATIFDRSGDHGSTWTYSQSITAGVNTFTDGAVLPTTEYSYRLHSTGAGGDSAYTEPVTVTTLPSRSSTPSGVMVAAQSTGALRLNWSYAGPTPDAFEVERQESGGSFHLLGNTDGAARLYTDASLAANNRYIYRLRARNAGGVSDYSSPASGTTLPLLPGSVSVTAASSRSVVVQWTDPNNPRAGAEVDRSGDGGVSWRTRVSLGAGTTTWTDSGVEPRSSYQYRLRSTGEAGASVYTAPLAVITPPDTPGVPANVIATAPSDTQVHLTWSYSGNVVDGFRIERKDAEGTFEPVAELGAGVREFADAGLRAATMYTYRVRSFAGDLVSDLSEPASVTTWATPAGKLVMPKTVNFGSVPVGSSKTLTVTLKNASRKDPLAVYQITTSTPFDGTIDGPTPIFLSPGGSKTVTLTFTPGRKHAEHAELSVETSASKRGSVRVELKGTGK